MIRLACGCSPVDGQSCPACDGQLAELGLTPPTPEPLPAWVGDADQDPWLNPIVPMREPF